MYKRQGYTASARDAQYYNAGGTYETNTTEYRLVLSSTGKPLTGAMTYGGIVSYELQERAITVSSDEAKTQTVGEWKKSEKTNLTYTVETTEKDRKKVDEVSQPLSVASYNFPVSYTHLVLNTRFWNNNAAFNLVIESEVVVDVSSGYFSGCDGTNNSSRTRCV